MKDIIGFTNVYVGNIERALIAYRRNSAEMQVNLDAGRQRLIDKYWGSKWRPYIKLRSWVTGVYPTSDEKVLSYSGGDSWWPTTEMFSSEYRSVAPLLDELLDAEDYKLWRGWYFQLEVEEYKAIKSLWENTPGEYVLLSDAGCGFVNTWGARYE